MNFRTYITFPFPDAVETLAKKLAQDAASQLLAFTGRRLRVRNVSEVNAIKETLRAALAVPGKPWITPVHGYSVPKGHKHCADTEAIFAAAYCDGQTLHAFVWAGRLPAVNVTRAGVAAKAGFRPILDRRYSDLERKEALARLKGLLLSKGTKVTI